MNTAQILAYLRRYPLVVTCAVVVIALGITSYFLREKQQLLASDHETKRRNGEDVLLSLSSLPRVTAELATVKEAVDFIDSNLIKEGDLAENLGYFYQLETISRVKLAQVSQLSSQPGTADSPFISIPFSLRVNGSYRQVMRFIRELETGPRLCRIQTYGLTGGAEDRVDVDITLEMLGHP